MIGIVGKLASAVLAVSLLQPTMPVHTDYVRDAEWYLSYLHVQQAWQTSRGAGVVVAVIDTGVNAKQPEISGNVLRGTDAYRDFTGDGQQDIDGHGTGMAGLIAAHGKGGNSGALGIAPDAKILPVRAGVGRNPSPESLRRSIEWAVDHGAKVLCIAIGGGPSDQWAPVLDEALKADVVIVAAVGNRTQGATQVAWPAAYPGVVAAAGIDRTGKHADLSVTGPEVALSAPAVNIVSPGRNGQYQNGSGTSAATAIIAGAAALIRAKYPTMPAAEVVHRLEATAIDAGPPGRDDEYGYGILNLVGALTAEVPPLKPSASPTAPAPASASPAAPAASAPQPDRDNTVRLLVLLGVLLAAAVAGTTIALRRARA
jgi:type VII secretion-associated serine protease mycosin